MPRSKDSVDAGSVGRKLLTGYGGAGHDAHHVFPRSFEPEFGAAGINIHEPNFGAWWELHDHRSNAVWYNEMWDDFLLSNPSRQAILNYGRELASQFGFVVNF